MRKEWEEEDVSEQMTGTAPSSDSGARGGTGQMLGSASSLVGGVFGNWFRLRFSVLRIPGPLHIW